MLGHLKESELKPLLENARAVVLPSLWPENMPYALLEAMAMSKLVLVSESGGMAEIIENKVNGFSFKVASSDDLAKIISEILEINKDQESEIRRNARREVEKLNSEDYYKKIIKLY